MSLAYGNARQLYLNEARIAAGNVSQSNIAVRLGWSCEKVGRHERGEVRPSPEDMIAYLQVYPSSILMHYCSECPVGQYLRRPPSTCNLQGSALRLDQFAELLVRHIARLKRIAFDGIIDRDERSDFDETMSFLQEFQAELDGLRMIAMQGSEQKSKGGYQYAI